MRFGLARIHALASALALITLLLGAWLILPVSDDPAARVVGTTADGWQIVEIDGAQATIPPSWERVSTHDCPRSWQQWAPPTTGCPDGAPGLGFFKTMTFDALDGPGVHRTRDDLKRESPAWTGYVISGDYAVVASDEDRESLVRMISQD